MSLLANTKEQTAKDRNQFNSDMNAATFPKGNRGATVEKRVATPEEIKVGTEFNTSQAASMGSNQGYEDRYSSPTGNLPSGYEADSIKTGSGTVASGNTNIEKALQVLIQPLDGEATVVGGMGDGSSMSIASNWESPFEQFVMGATKFATVAALLSSSTGLSVINQLTMTQVWRGTRPITFDISLILIATAENKTLVNDCLTWLAQMMSPSDSNDTTAGQNAASAADSKGYIQQARESIIKTTDGAISGSLSDQMKGAVLIQPSKISLQIGNRVIYPKCVIEAMSYDLDKPKDRAGNYLMNIAKLTITTVTMQLRSQINIK